MRERDKLRHRETKNHAVLGEALGSLLGHALSGKFQVSLSVFPFCFSSSCVLPRMSLLNGCPTSWGWSLFASTAGKEALARRLAGLMALLDATFWQPVTQWIQPHPLLIVDTSVGRNMLVIAHTLPGLAQAEAGNTGGDSYTSRECRYLVLENHVKGRAGEELPLFSSFHLLPPPSSILKSAFCHALQPHGVTRLF